MNRMILIDGNAIMHRAYHAMPPLTSPDGKSVSVVYGFLSMLIKIYHDFHPSHMAVAFDRPGPTFRDQLYAQYQKQRPKIDDDFIGQISMVHDAVKAFGVSAYECDGFEADDVIGTITKQTKSKKEIDQVIIITGDRDILQLVEDEKVLLFMPTKGLSEGKIYHEADVVTRLGIPPKLIPEFKALAGDQSDNYPGVPGIGPKTAVSILTPYRSIDALYAALEDSKTTLSKGVIEKLTKGKESAYLSLQLATIRRDAPVTFSQSAAHIKTLDSMSARKELEKYGFQSLLRRLIGIEQNKDVKVVIKAKTENEETRQQSLF
ncbi:MAG: 5'-3' exonuclease H3TH domain-containing protein [Patescibacteria group bacterium]